MLQDARAFSSFSVPDLAQAEEFYGSVLGLGIKKTPEGLEVQVAGGAPVFVYPSTENKPAAYTVLNFLVADVEAAVDALGEKGVTMEQYDSPSLKTDEKGIVRGELGPKAIAWFKDPAGNILSLIQK